MTPAEVNLTAALILRDSLRDAPADVREAAARAVVDARAALASERARLAMQPKGAAS